MQERKQIFVHEIDEFLAEYPDWLLEMPDGSLASVAHVTHETRSGDLTAWMLHTAEEPPRQVQYRHDDDLLIFKHQADPS